MSEKTLTEIRVDQIDPHPENPRKDLGDLTELAESIKTNGIMQNLTVIPNNMGRYTVVIGHRRLAAAKLAGLSTVPCAVVYDMDHKTQLSTMLLENMQRSELTYVEQADGFQMMLDLGETVESISELSGFSVNTVKHRLEIAKLNKENLKNSDLTLEDFAYLEKIDDIEKRNSIIKGCNHSNIRAAVDRTLNEIKTAKIQAEWIEYLDSLGIKRMPENAEYWRDYKYVQSFSISAISIDDFKLSEEVKESECLYDFRYGGWGYIYVKKEQPSSEELAEKARLEENRRIRLDKLEVLFNDLNDRARKFIDNLSETKTTLPVALRLIVELELCSYADEIEEDNIYDVAGIDNNEIPPKEDIAKGKLPSELLYLIDKQPGIFLLKLVFNNREIKFYDRYSIGYIASEPSQCIVRTLRTLGYNFTDEDNSLIAGTHDVYRKED